MLMTLLFLALDQSMLGWCPEIFNLGGLPKCTYDPMKSVPLCTLLNNASEFNAHTIFHNEVAQNPEK